MTPGVGAGRERFHTVLGLLEVLRHSALAAGASLERHPDQIALQIVAPTVVDAGVIEAVALGLAHHQRGAVGAAVDQGVNRAVLGAVHHD